MSLYRAYFAPGGTDPLGLYSDDTFGNNLAVLAQYLRECCKAAPPPDKTCEQLVKEILDQLRKSRQEIIDSGGPIFGITGRRGSNCSACEGIANKNIKPGPCIKYETIYNLGILTHTWGQLRCKATGEVIGTIDLWSNLDDCFKPGRDSCGWIGENHGDVDYWDLWWDRVQNGGLW